MVLHIAGAEIIRPLRVAAHELVEQDIIRLAHHCAQHVQPAAVRHADDDFPYAEIAAALDDLL